jgi:hypothetical protein
MVTVCRRILPVRRIDPAELTNIPAPRKNQRGAPGEHRGTQGANGWKRVFQSEKKSGQPLDLDDFVDDFS